MFKQFKYQSDNLSINLTVFILFQISLVNLIIYFWTCMPHCVIFCLFWFLNTHVSYRASSRCLGTHICLIVTASFLLCFDCISFRCCSFYLRLFLGSLKLFRLWRLFLLINFYKLYSIDLKNQLNKMIFTLAWERYLSKGSVILAKLCIFL